MEKDLIRIYQSQALEKRISKIERILRKNEKQLNKIQDSCKHEVLVFTEEEICYGAYDDKLYHKCLFCGIQATSRQVFGAGKCIDLSRYKEENGFTREEKFDMAKERFIKLAIEKPELTSAEIANYIQAQLDFENEKFREAMDEIHKRAKEKQNKAE